MSPPKDLCAFESSLYCNISLSKVAPSELEAVLLTHPAVVDAGVFGLPHPLAGELPTALVVRSPGASVTEKDIQDYVKEKVAAFKQLRGGVHFVSSVPRTVTGKAIRRAMKAKMAAKSNL
ncbi:Luciferin 4-monooxygenase [Lamellibrachia satsuma]|nr:Luciferin 4-monooxygenase [Lamellibrachia satsuma]